MKHLFAIITLIAMASQTFHMGIIETDFYINQQEIAQTLCENKARPESDCHGHCQLKKELEKNHHASDSQQVREISPFINVATFSIEKPPYVAGHAWLICDQSTIIDNFIADIFHPPGMIL